MTQIPPADSGRTCPFLAKDMSKVCHRCPMWVQVRGSNPNTGEAIDRWDCSLALLPLLLIENAQQSRQTGAAVESFRNEMVRSSQVQTAVLLQAASRPSAGAALLHKVIDDAAPNAR